VVGLTVFLYDEANDKFRKPYVLPSSGKNVKRHLFGCFGYEERVWDCGMPLPGVGYGGLWREFVNNGAWRRLEDVYVTTAQGEGLPGGGMRLKCDSTRGRNQISSFGETDETI
jgi:hypothetical protein